MKRNNKTGSMTNVAKRKMAKRLKRNKSIVKASNIYRNPNGKFNQP